MSEDFRERLRDSIWQHPPGAEVVALWEKELRPLFEAARSEAP